jgi:hypothetical protein
MHHSRLGPPAVLLGLVALAATACTRSIRAPDLGGLYSRSASEHDAGRNPVIVIPGILGSRLRDQASGRVVWGAFDGAFADPGRADGARLIALPMQPGATLAQLRDDVRPDGALDRVRLSLLGLPVQLSAYAQVLAVLGAGGYRDEGLGLAGAVDYGSDHFTCFQFDYDWRRDNVENARRLHGFILEKRAQVQQELARRGAPETDVRFDIVAHSMGGLIARYCLMYGDQDLPGDGALPALTWAGAPLVERLIMVGTPNAGSASSLLNLVDGAEFAFILPRYDAALLGTMPAIYQLLPRARHAAVLDRDGTPLDPLDPRTWEERGWGLGDPAQDRVLRALLPDVADPAQRRQIALDHQRKCLARARALADALDRPAQPPAGVELHLVAGDAAPTPAVLAADGAGRLRVAQRQPGDGTVLRKSALLDERGAGSWQRTLRSPIAWRRVTFLFTDHLGLTRDPAFADNVLYTLLEEPR